MITKEKERQRTLTDWTDWDGRLGHTGTGRDRLGQGGMTDWDSDGQTGMADWDREGQTGTDWDRQ